MRTTVTTTSTRTAARGTVAAQGTAKGRKPMRRSTIAALIAVPAAAMIAIPMAGAATTAPDGITTEAVNVKIPGIVNVVVDNGNVQVKVPIAGVDVNVPKK